MAQLEKQLYGAASERQIGSAFSKEQILPTCFPPAVIPANAEVAVPATAGKNRPRLRRQPAAQVLAVVTERLEPAEKVCAHCGKTTGEIGCEKSERFECVPAKIIRPKLACACKQGGAASRRSRRN